MPAAASHASNIPASVFLPGYIFGGRQQFSRRKIHDGDGEWMSEQLGTPVWCGKTVAMHCQASVVIVATDYN